MKHLTTLFTLVIVAALAFTLGAPTTTMAKSGGTLTSQLYGTTSDGVDVYEYTLTNTKRMEVKIITYGGIITSVRVPDHKHKIANVTLGFNNLNDYETKNNPYFGGIIGRYGNRIANGVFTLDGIPYCLDATTARTRCTVAPRDSTSRFGRSQKKLTVRRELASSFTILAPPAMVGLG
jgi:hypothetical protein